LLLNFAFNFNLRRYNEAIRRKRQLLKALAWQAWRVDSGKMSGVKKLLGQALSRAKVGRCRLTLSKSS
jgi:hypothetical protein